MTRLMDWLAWHLNPRSRAQADVAQRARLVYHLSASQAQNLRPHQGHVDRIDKEGTR